MTLIPVAGYNGIRVNDLVRCRPLRGHRFTARVLRIRADTEGTIVEVDVYGSAKGKQAAHIRTFRPDRIERMPQPTEERT